MHLVIGEGGSEGRGRHAFTYHPSGSAPFNDHSCNVTSDVSRRRLDRSVYRFGENMCKLGGSLGWSRGTFLACMSKRRGAALAFRRLAAQLQLSAEDSERPSSCVVPFFAPTHHSLFRSAVQHIVRRAIRSYPHFLTCLVPIPPWSQLARLRQRFGPESASGFCPHHFAICTNSLVRVVHHSHSPYSGNQTVLRSSVAS